MEGFTIRQATLADSAALAEIYAYYVEHTAITFEYEAPAPEAFAARMASIMAHYPYLTACCGEEIVGYAYAAPFKGRTAYDWAVEVTIYLKQGTQRRGAGRRLYAALEEALGRMGILNLYACIAFPRKEDGTLTRNSADFHAHMGYRTVGTFSQCGYKFGRWYDMIWMEKFIGPHGDNPPPVTPFGRLPSE